MRRIIINTMLLIGSTLCSDHISSSKIAYEYGHINQQESMLTSTAEESSSAPSQDSNKNVIQPNRFNMRASGSHGYTEEYPTPLDGRNLEKAMKCEHFEFGPSQNQRRPMPSLYHPSQSTNEHNTNMLFTHDPSCPAQSIDVFSMTDNLGSLAGVKRKLPDIEIEKKYWSKLNRWIDSRLKDKHKSIYPKYKPAYSLSKNTRSYKPNNIQHQSLLKEYVNVYKDKIGTLPPITRLLFIISTRTSSISTKLVDCEYMVAESESYSFMAEVNKNYSHIARSILDFIKKHGQIVTDAKVITIEWKETLGDIYMRKPVDKVHVIDKPSAYFKDISKYTLVLSAMQLILGLPEVCADLCKLTPKFLENTFTRNSSISLEDYTIIRAVYVMVNKCKRDAQTDISMYYEILWKVLWPIYKHQTEETLEDIVIQLYSRIYESITCFYKKAEICQETPDPTYLNSTKTRKKYSLLDGKCMIKPQKYLKYTVTLDLDNLSEESTYILDTIIVEEINRWSIKPDVKNHYHIHLVDNTKHQYKRICMPLYMGEGYIHSIGQIVYYIQEIYEIKDKKCVFPYKRDKETGAWSYVKEEDMPKTIYELYNYDIVFYYIEEDLLENHFTFAQFDSYMKPDGNTVPIPLFLSPLARSLAEMGPFEEAHKKKHAIVPDMRFINRLADGYTYKEEYAKESYTFIQNYYSNLYIRIDNADIQTIDCYIMDTQSIGDTVTWYVKVPSSVDEYTHCVLDKSFKPNSKEYREFVEAVRSQEYTPDSEMYGFGLHSADSIYSVGSAPSSSRNRQSTSQKQIRIFRLSTNPISKEIPTLLKKISDLKAKIDKDKKGNSNSPIKQPINKKDLSKRPYTSNIDQLHTYNTDLLMDLKLQLSKKRKKEKEYNANNLPFCRFLVFQTSNVTKSGLGSLNELFDALVYRYSNYYSPYYSPYYTA